MRNVHNLRSGAKLLIGFVFALSPQLLIADSFTQLNLVSDVSGKALTTDSDLKNPWGVSFGATSPFWISNQASGTSTLYDGAGNKVPLTVPIPGGPPPSGPTGQVFAGGSGFTLPDGKTAAFFIFDTLNGTIDGWGGTNPAVQLASTPGAIYTGLALASSSGTNYLYAADSTGSIRVFDSSYHQVTLAGNFTDPHPMAGFVPFNIQLVGSQLYVTYAQLTSMGTGLPGGYVDVFNTDGTFVKRFATGGALNAPWGISNTLAPAGFGSLGGDLLIGNFENGEINAYNPTTGAWVATLDGTNGKPIVNDFLWSLEFRTGGKNVNTNALYFTAGINGQKDGLFGEISTPEPDMAIPVLFGLVALVAAHRRRRRARAVS
ncbi:MAG: TIGR03118 family protein [Acidobacteriaceae bacterium]|nr:TIGR03118 family protein [Acidobacteriaceae bacterium]MBV9501978.1 TIGR03118 family protein [Acidobacteriaceae bacterium]